MTDKHEKETATGYERRMAEAFAALAKGKGFCWSMTKTGKTKAIWFFAPQG